MEFPMSTPDTNNHSTGNLRRTRSAVRLETHEPADADAGGAADASSRQRAGPPVSLLVGLLDLIARLLNARIPRIINRTKEKITDLLHSGDDDGVPAIQQRLSDAGSHVMAWGRQHPGQVVAVGAAVLTAAVLVGVLLHRSENGSRAGAAASRGAKRKRKGAKGRREQSGG
jgi:hypothetical protein